MANLQDYIDKNSKFVNFKDVAEHILLYVKNEVIKNPFDKADEDTQTVQYFVEEDDNERTFLSQNIGLAQMMIGREGKRIKITRTGTGNATKWKVENESPKEE